MDHTPASAITQAKKDLVTSIKEKLEAVSSLKSIFRVPEKLLEANEKMYIPSTVSIGPLHHGKEGLKYMEDRKWHYLFTLLSRQPNQLESSLHEFVNALSDLEKPARNFYAEELNLTCNQFMEMMLVDGCFIIELFLKYSLEGIRRRGDPTFTTPGLLNRLRCDLILLENQIPFLILQRLFQIVLIPIKYDLTLTLSELAVRFFRKMLPGDKEIVNEKFSQEGYHLLDLIRHCFLPTYARVMSKRSVSQGDLETESATKLKKDGIKSKSSKAKSLLNIKFANGVLEVPSFTPHHHFTEMLFSNLIALEQHQNDSQPFTSYAFLMKALVCNENDVKLFRNRGIVIMDNYTEKEVCDLFKRLCGKVEYGEDKFYFAGLIEQIFEYKRTPRSWRKILKFSWLKTRTST
ncbi:hypothetical protein AAZX31_07G222300 [Glycine max]|uniref:Uncharacterized protein n=1 Tax=Glycine max TaxID=3847 RepID=I1KMR7_SOYBN|nr:UPF0481 protein At3g47200 [Glycine max]KAG5011056.1 hypothetical protein JHK87_019571 [Glycine soja]KAG4401299.1 hypothetical protein GLYMA_07G240400v4 [Glycine max]KAG5023795.1 hypothetical protein JHK85_020137 [Glycine max]KAG5038871.1 hypothetical protein JHK86_019711 [Glycine max]KAG5143999.1 hypothetical protein JHK82_019694 [Glycine max]|eukprot:XP_006584002.1 UPF0481 protein At3g47200 [Glycine max]